MIPKYGIKYNTSTKKTKTKTTTTANTHLYFEGSVLKLTLKPNPIQTFNIENLYLGRVMRKGPGRHILSIFSFKLFRPPHSPNNMMEVIKVRK